MRAGIECADSTDFEQDGWLAATRWIGPARAPEAFVDWL
jgi:hypothetical protein